MELFNPFVCEGYAEEDYFCDRQKETAEIISALLNGRSITLIAERRMGKSGLLRHIIKKVNEGEDAIACFVDLYSLNNYQEFLVKLLNAIMNANPSKGAKVMNNIKPFLTAIKPKFTVDEHGAPSFSLESGQIQTDSKTIEDIFRYIGSLDKPVFIIFDEFQEVVNVTEVKLEALIRECSHATPNVQIVFCGRDTSMMTQIFTSPKKPLYQSTQIMKLGKIDKTIYAEFIKYHFNKRNKDISDEAIEYIFDFTFIHTYYVQYFCNRLFEATPKKKTATLALAKQVSEEIIAQTGKVYEGLKYILATNQWRFISILACSNQTNLFESSFIHRYKLKQGSIATTLSALKKMQLVYFDEDVQHYVVTDVFFYHWLRKIYKGVLW